MIFSGISEWTDVFIIPRWRREPEMDELAEHVWTSPGMLRRDSRTYDTKITITSELVTNFIAE
jgi:hypothetical protein